MLEEAVGARATEGVVKVSLMSLKDTGCGRSCKTKQREERCGGERVQVQAEEGVVAEDILGAHGGHVILPPIAIESRS